MRKDRIARTEDFLIAATQLNLPPLFHISLLGAFQTVIADSDVRKA